MTALHDRTTSLDAPGEPVTVHTPAGTVVGRGTGRKRRFLQRAVSVSGGLFDVGEAAARDVLERVASILGVPPTRTGFGSRTVGRIQQAVSDLPSESGDGALVLGPLVGDDVLPLDVADGLAGLRDPAREYGRPGAALAADTTGVFDPVVRAVSEQAEVR